MANKAAKKPVGRGEAGRSGDDVRSDASVFAEIHDSGGLKLDVVSKVGSFYGNSIRATAESVSTKCGVEHGRIAVDDKGALPFVLAARIEAALLRAGVAGSAPPDRVMAPPEHTDRDRLRRSRLYLPGNEPKFMINAGLHKPDAVILDLEDSVHPNEKDAARILVRNALRCVDFHGAERMVRINQLPLGLIDLEEIVPESPHLILIPKVENADQVREVAQRIENIQAGESMGPVWLMPILESALGIENAFEIARATDSVVAITIGLEDYTADLGVSKTAEGNESMYARVRLVNAAHAAGVQAIDSVFGDVGDMEGLKAWARRSRSLGFEGMGCIHPRQIQPIHESFAPTPEEVAKAQRIVAAFEDAEAKGLGVVSLGSRMVDPPVVLRAQRLVEQATRAGLITATDDPGGGAR
jgi:citrate lyase subunit beta/citryl-CoA lyase